MIMTLLPLILDTIRHHLAGPRNIYKECICRIQNESLLLFSGLGLVEITGKRKVQLLVE